MKLSKSRRQLSAKITQCLQIAKNVSCITKSIFDTKNRFFATCWFEVVDVKRPQNFNEKLLLTFTKTFYVKSESLGLLKGSSSCKNKLTLIFLRKASNTRFKTFYANVINFIDKSRAWNSFLINFQLLLSLLRYHETNIKSHVHCLKTTQNVSFDFFAFYVSFEFLHFQTIFVIFI